ncbi:MAG: thioredoxin [Alphaproteobacteria bacterium]|nr:thioredoxin [Alphaproteobacteria bacterium]OJV46819.1 MAG: thioredoxin [Alphaproteobacteria bacterium 43-37]
MKNITDESFETDVIQSDLPVVVDFWAEWCGPCRMLAPVLDELSEELSGKVSIVKINIDENPEIPTSFGIRSIPTLMIFKGGERIAVQTGGSPKTSLKSWIESNI